MGHRLLALHIMFIFPTEYDATTSKRCTPKFNTISIVVQPDPQNTQFKIVTTTNRRLYLLNIFVLLLKRASAQNCPRKRERGRERDNARAREREIVSETAQRGKDR